MTMQIIAFTGCVYLAQMIFGPTGWVNQDLALDTLWYKKPWQFYQLLSYGFLHSLQAVQHILFNMYGLWLFGRDIEERYGRREFLSFYLSAILIAGLMWNVSTLLSGETRGVLIGASGGTVAVTILFALNFPHRKLLLMFLFPVPMWAIGCIIVFSDAFGAINNSDINNVAFMAHLGGAGFALLYYRTRWNPGRWVFDKVSSLSSAQSRSRAKLRIHAPDDDDSESDRQVDEILKKIQAQGQDSLTRRERRILEKASDAYQRKRR
jgi:membrane associated rhomboid family serine protease